MIFDVNSGEVAAYDLESDPNEMAPVKFASPDVRPLLHRQTPAPKTASRCL
jgi:hypothetical protein